MIEAHSIVLAEFPVDGQVIIVIIALIGAAIKAIIEKVQAAKNPGRDFPEHEGEDYSDDAFEAYREEIVARQTQLQEPTPPPLPVPTPPSLPPVKGTRPPTPLPPAASGRVPLPIVRKPVLSTAEKAALQRVSESGSLSPRQRRRESSGSNKGIRALLSTPQAARQAIILREVLGPPGGRHSE